MLEEEEEAGGEGPEAVLDGGYDYSALEEALRSGGRGDPSDSNGSGGDSLDGGDAEDASDAEDGSVAGVREGMKKAFYVLTTAAVTVATKTLRLVEMRSKCNWCCLLLFYLV